jgi:hypothetical protein
MGISLDMNGESGLCLDGHKQGTGGLPEFCSHGPSLSCSLLVVIMC